MAMGVSSTPSGPPARRAEPTIFAGVAALSVPWRHGHKVRIPHHSRALDSAPRRADNRGMDWTDEIDARGLRCPLPVLKAQKRLREMAPGAVLRLAADDAMALVDVPHFCGQAGHALLESRRDGQATIFLIRRGATSDHLDGS